MRPMIADAAATAGLASTISLLFAPMRPTKLRFVVDTARSLAARTPQKPPRHGPQVGIVKMAPASTKMSTSPSNASVGAAADDRLIDGKVAALSRQLGILRQMRQ